MHYCTLDDGESCVTFNNKTVVSKFLAEIIACVLA